MCVGGAWVCGNMVRAMYSTGVYHCESVACAVGMVCAGCSCSASFRKSFKVIFEGPAPYPTNETLSCVPDVSLHMQVRCVLCMHASAAMT